MKIPPTLILWNRIQIQSGFFAAAAGVSLQSTAGLQVGVVAAILALMSDFVLLSFQFRRLIPNKNVCPR